MKWEDVRRILDGNIPQGHFTSPNGASLSVEPALEADLSQSLADHESYFIITFTLVVQQ